jgi:hypothetical protein
LSAESVALIRSAECEAVWLPDDEERWGADDLDEPAELVFYCPGCAEREFGAERGLGRNPQRSLGPLSVSRRDVVVVEQAAQVALESGSQFTASLTYLK